MLIITIVVVFISYFYSLLFFLSGLFKSKEKISENYYPGISVVLCVRNGENSIELILEDLKNQKYKGDIEFIIIDDNSTDLTSKKILDFIALDNRFKYVNTKEYNSDLNHKKKALSYGIKTSKYEWLLFTDVNCRVGINWAAEFSKYYKNSDYIIGYSKVKQSKTLVSKFQSIDFMMLMFSALGCSLNNSALASSGQNQSYRKSLYQSVNGFKDIKNLLQGDDSIFLQLCKSKKNIKISFSEGESSHVSAKTHNNFTKFILQRIRWAGDANIMWKYNKLFFSVILSTYFSNLFLLYLIGMNIFTSEYIYITFSIGLMKFILEFSIYYLGIKRLKQSFSFNSFMFWFICQPLYVVSIGSLSFFVNQIKWKGRTV